MVFRGVYPECHGSASGMVLGCIRKAKMAKKTVGGSVPGIHFEIMYIAYFHLRPIYIFLDIFCSLNKMLES